MTLRCPYCKQVFTPSRGPKCPHCGRVMFMPRRFYQPATGGSTAGRLATRRERRTRTWESGLPRWLAFTRRPRYIVFLIGLLLLVGTVVIRRAGRSFAPPPAPGQHAERGAWTEFWQRLLNLPPPERMIPPEQRARESLHTLRVALELFRHDCGRYPTTQETLYALIKRPRGLAGWSGPYIKALWLDPWNRPYEFAVINGVLVLRSRGPDGQPGTADDVPAPEPDAAALREFGITNPPGSADDADVGAIPGQTFVPAP